MRGGCYEGGDALGSAPVSDITVVALSIGEPYAGRALESAQRQTRPPVDVVEVRDVSPFHCALNLGAARVGTPFFVQLDADVILDETCFAQLRELMDDNVSLVSGMLRDPVVGRTHGVRLYRTACFEQVQIRDSISPDMDFQDDSARLGWIRSHLLCWPSPDRATWHTVGDHQPSYTPLYTYSKFRLAGVRSRYRRREGRAYLMLDRLGDSDHPVAPLALIATAHGFFDRQESDLLVPYRRTADFETVQDFLSSNGGSAPPPPPADADPLRRFTAAYGFGVACRRARASTAFLAHLECLRRVQPRDPIAIAGACHGLFADAFDADAAREAYATLAEIL